MWLLTDTIEATKRNDMIWTNGLLTIAVDTDFRTAEIAYRREGRQPERAFRRCVIVAYEIGIELRWCFEHVAPRHVRYGPLRVGDPEAPAALDWLPIGVLAMGITISSSSG